MNSYSDIALDAVKNLNTRLLNQSFKKIQANDEQLLPINNYIPNIWENRWFNKQVAGYPKGYVVWKYTMTSSDFYNQFGNLVYKYAQGNEKLRSYLLSSWDAIVESKDSEVSALWIPKYENVISGYNAVVSTYYDSEEGKYKKITKQLFGPLFEYGPKASNASEERIQLYISTIDDNKEYLSNTIAWKNAVISSQGAFEQYIKDELSLMFDKHLDDYHLGGLSTMENVDDNFLANNLSNFNLEQVFNKPKVTSHYTYLNSDGFDYVVKFHKNTYTCNVDGNDYFCYKMFRIWNSGYLEHFGTVSCGTSQGTDISDYFISVDLDWEYEENGETFTAPVYDYIQTSSFYGQRFSEMYYAENKTELNQIIGSDKYKRYNVSITPMLYHNDDYIQSHSSDRVFNGNLSSLSAYSYQKRPLSNIASSYVTVELHHMTNSSFCFTKSNTNNLANDDVVQFYSYYTNGYLASYAIETDLNNVIVSGINKYYYYTGKEICPKLTLKLPIGKTLREEIDYNLTYANNIQPGTASIEIKAVKKSKYVYGSRTIYFQINKDISECIIDGINDKYELT